MKSLKNIFHGAFTEIVIILLFAFSIFTLLKPTDQVIKADGFGYYDYLPSIFIEGDFNRKNYIQKEAPDLYHRIQKEGVYVEYNDKFVNKYPVGTALLISPFYGITSWIYGLNHESYTGYEKVFQYIVVIAAMFYLFFSLVFLRKTLELYDISRRTTIIVQILMVSSTSVVIYSGYEASFAHVFSLFATCGFLYYTKSFFKNNSPSILLKTSIFIGLAILIKQLNVLLILAIPFISGSQSDLQRGLKYLFSHFKTTLFAFLLVLLIFSIQSIAWYFQTGDLFLDSYQNESFNFLDPHFVDILFSYKKGLFLYTPILLISLGGLRVLCRQKRHFELVTWIGFFIILTYILSSWWSWYFGGSFGHRAYIEYYPLFFILLAFVFEHIQGKLKWVVLILSILTIPICYIQAWQYKNYVIHMTEMDKESYWKVFLKPTSRLTGILYKDQFSKKNYRVLDSISIPEVKAVENYLFEFHEINFSNFSEQEVPIAIEMELNHHFNFDNKSQLGLMIKNIKNDSITYLRDPFLIHYSTESFGKEQQGKYTFTGPGFHLDQECKVVFFLKTIHTKEDLKTVTIRLLK